MICARYERVHKPFMYQNLNRRHRASKQAQRDSVELFQSLYFKNKEETVESIIYDIRSNGFMVFVPKYGIRFISS